jgi:hypothetical protein
MGKTLAAGTQRSLGRFDTVGFWPIDQRIFAPRFLIGAEGGGNRDHRLK